MDTSINNLIRRAESQLTPVLGGRWPRRGWRASAAVSTGLLASLLTPETFGQFQYQRLTSFGDPSLSGGGPRGLTLGSDGALYGTTLFGGTNNGGFVFRVLRYFSGSDGGSPTAALVRGSAGALYGTTQSGGSSDDGTVVMLNEDGSGFAVLHNSSGFDGASPAGALSSGPDGSLYGATGGGGDMGFGTIFALRPQSVLLPPVASNGGITVRVSSVPGSIHQLQRASILDGTWLTMTNLAVATNGVAEFADPTLPQPAGFYRTVTP